MNLFAMVIVAIPFAVMFGVIAVIALEPMYSAWRDRDKNKD